MRLLPLAALRRDREQLFPHRNPFFKVIDHFLSKILKDNLSSNTIFYLLYVLHYQLKKSPETLEADM